MQKNLQRHTKVHGMRPVGCKDRLINRSEDVLADYPACVISVAVLVAACCLTMHVSFSLCCALQRIIFICLVT